MKKPIALTAINPAEASDYTESVREPSKLEKKWHRLTEYKTHLEAAVIKAEEIRKKIHALGSPESMNQKDKELFKEYKIDLLIVEGQFEVDQNDFQETLAAAENLLKKQDVDISPDLQATINAMHDYNNNVFPTLQKRFEQAGNEPAQEPVEQTLSDDISVHTLAETTEPEPPQAPQTKRQQYQELLAKLAEVHRQGSDLYAVVTVPPDEKERQQIAASKLEKFQTSPLGEQEEMIFAAQAEILTGLTAQQSIAAAKLDFITATYRNDLITLDRYLSRDDVEYNYLENKSEKTHTDLRQQDYQLEQYAQVEEYVTGAIGSPEQYSNPIVKAYAENILDSIETYHERQDTLHDKMIELQKQTAQSLQDPSKWDRARDNSMQKNLQAIEKLNTKRENYYNQYDATEDKSAVELMAAGVELYQSRCAFVDGFTPGYIQNLKNIVANKDSVASALYQQAQTILTNYQESLALVIKQEPKILGTTYRDPKYLDPNNPRPPVQVGLMHILRDKPSADLSAQQLAATAEQTSLQTTLDSLPQRLLMIEAIEKANNAYLESIQSEATVSDEKFMVLYNLREQYVNQLSETERLFLAEIATPKNSFSSDEQSQAQNILTEFEQSQTFLLEQKDLATIIHNEQKQAAKATTPVTAQPLATQQLTVSDTDNKHKAAAGYPDVKQPAKLEKYCGQLTDLQATLDKLIADRNNLLEKIKSIEQNNPDNNQLTELLEHQLNLEQKNEQLDLKIYTFTDILNKANERANNTSEQSAIGQETRDKLAQFNTFAAKLSNEQNTLNQGKKEPPSPFEHVER